MSKLSANMNEIDASALPVCAPMTALGASFAFKERRQKNIPVTRIRHPSRLASSLRETCWGCSWRKSSKRKRFCVTMSCASDTNDANSAS